VTTNALAALRGRMRDALAENGLSAFSTAPENAAPPLVYVGPGDPYISRETAAFGHVVAHNQVVLVASPGVNESAADELDQMVVDALAALEDIADAFTVGRPGHIAISGQECLGVGIATQTEIDPNETFKETW